MKKLICGILVVILLLFSACASGSDFNMLLKEANALHKAQINMMSENSIHDFLPTLPETDVGFTEEELISLTKNLGRVADENKLVTISQAKQDIDLLFRTLRFCYGPYEYFGGDDAFEEAQTAIISDISVLGASFQIGELIKVLKERLSFIQDGHFLINGKPVMGMYSYFSSEKPEFVRDDTGYYTMLDNGKQYVKSIDGDADIEAYMKLSIGSDGRLVYSIGTLCAQTSKQFPVYSTCAATAEDLPIL